MKKTSDWFFAGLVAGAIGGAGILLLNVILLLLGIEHGTYWEAMGGLFYNKELLKTWSAQLHGMIDAIGVSAVNGVLLSATLVVTGRDYLYIKSVALSSSGAYFLFLVVYPQTGLGKDSLIIPWIALFGHTVFNGLLTGYILNRICSFNNNISLTRKKTLETNTFAEEIAAPISVTPFAPQSYPSWSKGDKIKAAKVMADSVTIEWPPASDDSGHIKYRILVNDVFVGETDNTTYIVSSLEPATSYTFSIEAENEAGNRTEIHQVKKVRTRRGKKVKCYQ